MKQTIVLLLLLVVAVWVARYLKLRRQRSDVVHVAISYSLGGASFAQLFMCNVTRERLQCLTVTGSLFNELYTGCVTHCAWKTNTLTGSTRSIFTNQAYVFEAPSPHACHTSLRAAVQRCLDTGDDKSFDSVTVECPLSNVFLTLGGKVRIMTHQAFWHEDTSLIVLIGFSRKNRFVGKYYPVFVARENRAVYAVYQALADVLQSCDEQWQAAVLCELISTAHEYATLGMRTSQRNYISNTIADGLNRAFVESYLSGGEAAHRVHLSSNLWEVVSQIHTLYPPCRTND